MLPLMFDIPYGDPAEIFAQFADQPGSILLDSACVRPMQSEVSYILLDPFITMTAKADEISIQNESVTDDPFLTLDRWLKKYPMQSYAHLPMFQGGVAGYFGYDLAHHIETLPLLNDPLAAPDLALGFYDIVLAYSHSKQKAYLFSSGYPEQEPARRRAHAESRAQWVIEVLSKTPTLKRDTAALPVLKVGSNFTQAEYEATVGRVIEYIYAGDIFEANLAQRYEGVWPNECSTYGAYHRLRTHSAAPFSAYVNFDALTLLSASPERFIKLQQGYLETRPIKGTCPRGSTQEEDAQLASNLQTSEKDCAENVMIVDLMRNDFSKICEPESVQVTQLCGLESFTHVHHLVSAVEGKLLPGKTAVDVLSATFPGGSITGAPKVRAMEVIAECESLARGPYCGAIGYIGFDGSMDTSITIRTIAIKDEKFVFQVGGAILADSDPRAEYEETLVKAAGIRDALGIEFR